MEDQIEEIKIVKKRKAETKKMKNYKKYLQKYFSYLLILINIEKSK